MRKYLTLYIKEIEVKLKDTVNQENLRELVTKIMFFQQERLIHLIVTISFVFFMLIFMALGTLSYLFLIPGFILVIFVLFYIFHYFFLENSVQYLYKLYDEMNDRLEQNR